MAVHLRETPVAVLLPKGKYDFFDWMSNWVQSGKPRLWKTWYDPQVARNDIRTWIWIGSIRPYMLFMRAFIVAISVLPCFSSPAVFKKRYSK
jgi:hypothetical protein